MGEAAPRSLMSSEEQPRPAKRAKVELGEQPISVDSERFGYLQPFLQPNDGAAAPAGRPPAARAELEPVQSNVVKFMQKIMAAIPKGAGLKGAVEAARRRQARRGPGCASQGNRGRCVRARVCGSGGQRWPSCAALPGASHIRINSGRWGAPTRSERASWGQLQLEKEPAVV